MILSVFGEVAGSPPFKIPRKKILSSDLLSPIADQALRYRYFDNMMLSTQKR